MENSKDDQEMPALLRFSIGLSKRQFERVRKNTIDLELS